MYDIGFVVPESKLSKMDFHVAEALSRTSCPARLHVLGVDELSTTVCKVVVHKMTYDMAKMPADAEATRRVAKFRDFESGRAVREGIVVIDPLAAIDRIMTRSEMYTILNAVSAQLAPVMQPVPFTVLQLEHGESERDGIPLLNLTEMVENQLHSDHVRVPVIVKLDRAAGTPDTHDMAVCFSAEQIAEIIRGGSHGSAARWVLQSYIDHNSVIYKVYVIGTRVHVIKRTSTANMSQATVAALQEHSQKQQEAAASFSSPPVSQGRGRSDSWAFNSQDFARDHNASIALDAGDPPLAVFEDIVQRTSLATGLSLYGIDVIRDVATGCCSVIDINFFPGYSSVPDFWRELIEYCKARYPQS